MAVRDVVQAAAGVGGDKLYVEDVFSTYLYTGTGTTQTITNGIDLAGEGGLTWFKTRVDTEFHTLFDTERGTSSALYTNATNAAGGPTNGVTSFNSDGFTLGSLGAVNGTYGIASWTLRKSPKFFDVVTWTGDGVAGRTVAHNLGSVPGCIIVKRTNAAENWFVYHHSLTASNRLQLNTTDATTVESGPPYQTWNQEPTDSVFYVGSTNRNNGAGSTYVAYVFAHDAGGFGDDGEQNVISCGSYTGNGSSTGPVINLGWEPQWVLIKNATSSANWMMQDVMRGLPVGGNYANLTANNADAEIVDSPRMNITSTGFQIKTTNSTYNSSGNTYIYIAIRRPMKTPESGTEVFAVDSGGSGNTPAFDSGFPVDFALRHSKGGGNHSAYARLTGNNFMTTDTTSAESTNTNLTFDFMDGYYTDAGISSDAVTNMWRRAPGFMDVVAYTGTGNASAGQNLTLSHNLQATPEMMIVKRRSPSGTSWYVYHSALGNTKFCTLDGTAGASTATAAWNDTSPTSSQFTVGSYVAVNYTGYTYIAYLFTSLPEVSKVGSYTGTGATQTINCGFSSGARFVLIKRTDSTGDWYVWDSVRGIVAGNDPYVLLNSTAAEVTTTDYIDPVASGFEISSSAPAAINASGGSYIFLAIA